MKEEEIKLALEKKERAKVMMAEVEEANRRAIVIKEQKKKEEKDLEMKIYEMKQELSKLRQASEPETVEDHEFGTTAGSVKISELFGDNDQPGGICPPLSGNGGADPAPLLRQFTEQFVYHEIGSVCAAARP